MSFCAECGSTFLSENGHKCLKGKVETIITQSEVAAIPVNIEETRRLLRWATELIAQKCKLRNSADIREFEAALAASREDDHGKRRCAVCGWPLQIIDGDESTHCRPGDCSMRPLPIPVDPERAIKEYGEYAPESWKHIKRPEQTFTESDLNEAVAKAYERCAIELSRTGSGHVHPYLVTFVGIFNQMAAAARK